MKKIKMILMITFLGLSLSCKKEEVKQISAKPIVSSKKIKSEKNFSEVNYEVGGTIGCFIGFTDPLNTSYGSNDAYDSCMDEMLAGTNLMGNISTGPGKPIYPATECLPCIVPADMKKDLMEYFFGLLGEQTPVSALDFERVRNKIAVYGTTILSVYTVNGELVIPEDRSERGNKLLSYGGILPSGIIPYVDFVYGKYFGIPNSWEASIYPLVLQPNIFGPTVLDINGKYSIQEYGVKIIKG
ncbi:hypothetical protein [Pedobacter sp. D749]|uniref:hypothetical protein n=1 Tax=Pedobacter sp. D749 TaxID=2856523 RepID=UPI001C57A2EF|nr:hypothetical protein [Pedobacter sp. D749]QXU40680.1 hypothetical protein KYH19_16975 [Pedobacter sp. D749]